MSDKAQLVSMGFDEARVAWALKSTKNSGLQPAMDFLLAHVEDPIPAAGDDEDEDMEDGANKLPEITDADAKSLKCTDCGKIFKNEALANFHAEKAGHANFEQSTEEVKPLTEEEKKQRLAELKEKMAAKRALKAEQEAKDNKANEFIRRKQGQDAGSIREELQIKEANKEAIARKKEKEADRLAKIAIKAQIEQDKKDRAEKAAREKALREGREPERIAGGVDVTKGTSGLGGSAVSSAGGSKASSSAETRLQARITDGGSPIQKSFPSTSTLTSVEEWLASENLTLSVGAMKISTRFPNKTFGPSDGSKTLSELGLSPSAVIFVSPL